MTKKESIPVYPTLGNQINPKATYICGCDVARKGKDETAIVILEKVFNSDEIFVVFAETLHTPDLMAALARLKHLDKLFNFKKIYLDETGLGAGLTDMLRNELGYKVEGVVFTRGSKAEMFTNLKLLMSRKAKKIHFPNYLTSTNPIVKKLFYQLLTIRQEFSGSSDVPKIYHEENKHDDLVCALALAAMYYSPKSAPKRSFFGIGLSR